MLQRLSYEINKNVIYPMTKLKSKGHTCTQRWPHYANIQKCNNSGVVVDSDGKFKRQGDKFPQLSLKRGTFKAYNTPLYPYYVDRI